MAKSVPFTQRMIEGVACPPDRKDLLLFDGELRGFGLRVTSGGAKVFLAQFVVNGVKRRVRVGAFGTLTVREARERARALLGQAAAGTDPVAERLADARRREAEQAAARLRSAAGQFTFGKLIQGWRDAREGDRRPGYLKEADASMRRHFAIWLDRPASSITRAEALDELDRIKVQAGGVASNRCLAYSRAAFGWAVKRGRLAANPMEGVEALVREKSRDRVLVRDEVGAIWRAAGKLNSSQGAFVQMLIITLQRRDEVAGMRWEELDDPKKPTIWTIAGERAKNHRAHIVHLSEPAQAIIAAMPRIKGCALVFPSEQLTPLSAFSAIKRRLLAKMNEEVAGQRGPDPVIEDEAAANWRFHDFRRTGVTALASMGFAPHVADKLLNHVTGAIQGVAAVYQRAEFLSERKEALEAWSEFVLAAADRQPQPGNVIPFSVRAGE